MTDLRTAAQQLASAASCFIQCADVAVGEDRKACQTHLWKAEQALRAALAARPEPSKPPSYYSINERLAWEAGYQAVAGSATPEEDT